jgi:hypothetical protein
MQLISEYFFLPFFDIASRGIIFLAIYEQCRGKQGFAFYFLKSAYQNPNY